MIVLVEALRYTPVGLLSIREEAISRKTDNKRFRSTFVWDKTSLTGGFYRLPNNGSAVYYYIVHVMLLLFYPHEMHL